MFEKEGKWQWMLMRLERKIIGKLLQYHLIEKDYVEYYEYALQCQLEMMLTYTTIFIIAALSGYLFETTGFLIIFLTLRKRTGGFHLNSFFGCYLSTVGVYCFLLYTNAQAIIPKGIYYLLTILSCFVIAFIGAVNHPNINWSKTEQKESATCARWILGIEIFVIFFICMLHTDKLLERFLMSGIILCAFLMLLSKIKGQEVRFE